MAIAQGSRIQRAANFAAADVIAVLKAYMVGGEEVEGGKLCLAQGGKSSNPPLFLLHMQTTHRRLWLRAGPSVTDLFVRRAPFNSVLTYNFLNQAGTDS
ncbi:hypothetical protein J6590_018984 [Homalodisca vitripennis]|nr:hypothetical protein J6590_018984 [Homalodisca vitripennis]